MDESAVNGVESGSIRVTPIGGFPVLCRCGTMLISRQHGDRARTIDHAEHESRAAEFTHWTGRRG